MGWFPESIELAIRYASIAELRVDNDELVRRWESVRQHFPDAMIGYAGLGGALRKNGQLHQSEAILDEGGLRFADCSEIALERAWLELEKGDFDAAVRRWQEVVARFPNHPIGYTGTCLALRKALRLDEADALMLTAMQRFPRFLSAASEYAINATIRGDRYEALRRWQVVREKFPDDPIGYAGLGGALRMVQQFDDAAAVLDSGLARFPRDANLAINRAWLSTVRQDWSGALRQWRVLRERFPENPFVKSGWSETVWHANLADTDNRVAAASAQGGLVDPIHSDEFEIAPGGDLETRQLRKLLMGFESLGENCEFGFVQRYFGAEPLGLIRWAGIPFEKLIAGLENEFGGVGTDENTIVYVDPSNQEYRTEDKKYYLSMHTFILDDGTNIEDISKRLCKRLQYLRRKFLEDLHTAEKILVFLSCRQVPETQMYALHAALRRYGRNTLLWVHPAGDRQSPGVVETASEGLLVGYLDKLGYDGRRWDISFEIWRRLCEEAHRLLSSTRSL